jgi:acetoin utilization deacetylase AcuC-like enzyme
MLAFHSDAHSLALPPGHRFPQSKYRLLREHFEREPGLLRMQPAPAASEGELALVHTPDYVDAVLMGRLSAAEQREIGFPWSPSVADRSCRSVGATIAAARAALAEGVAANMAGGTHHAYADKGSGYCVFNDVAVAARLMQAEWGRLHGRLLRILVIDLDVHQGNGTAAVCRGDDTIYTFSVHGAKNYPLRKETSDLDVELPDRTPDGPYLDAVEWGLAQALTAAGADFAVYLAGADPFEGDRLGRLAVSKAGLAERDRLVFDALRSRGLPVVVTMAGGYAQDVIDTVDIQWATVARAIRLGRG